MAAWLLPAATLVSGLLGYKSSKDASKAQNKAIAAQQASEAQKAALANEQIALADRMLYGQGYVPGQGVDSRPGQGGAMDLSQEWTNNYLNWLKTSPDITYNAQRGAMEGNIRDSMAAAASALGRRGLSTANVQSGAALRTMGSLGMARTGLLANLEAGRQDRMGERLGMGSQLTQGLLDRALNVRSAALGQSLGQQTMIPQMQANLASQYGQQAGAFGNLTGTLLDYYAQSRQPSVQIPTTVPMATGAASSVPNQFADFRMQPQGFGSVPQWRF